jgi:hypothetical protein
MSRLRILVAATLAVLVVAAGTFAAVRAFQGGSTKASAPPRKCPARTGTGAYDTALRPSSGAPGSTVTVSGPLPVMREDGTYGGQTATQVDVYWNLSFDHWPSFSGSSPVAAVAGSRVRHLGTQDVATLCRYQVQVEIPAVSPGIFPIEVLYQGPDSGGPSVASFAPTNFQVTSG